MDLMWVSISAALVFLMQAGFLCLESGRIRSKNSINVAAKNLSDFLVSIMLFWLIGFGLMFGQSLGGVVGITEFVMDSQLATPDALTFLLFQAMFCGTAATIVSGAVAERMTFSGYLAITVVLCLVVYPIVGHWAWKGIYSGADGEGWLEGLGFVDFAGATVVHSVGGWVALAAIIIIGPRLKRFDHNVKIGQGSNLPLAALGTLLIWFGWIGFNGGSALLFDHSVPVILMNTFLAAAAGGLVTAALFQWRNKYMDVSVLLNGVIAGLVAVTAGCHAVSSSGAVIIGGVGGALSYVASCWLIKQKLDDALDVVSAHMVAGAWGTIAVALFGNLSVLGTELSRWELFLVQALGVAVIGAYSFSVGYVAIKAIGMWVPLRVTAEQEEAGLNVSEHKATTEIIDLLNSMSYQQAVADFSYRVPVEPFTEVGQIAKQYNQVLERVSEEIVERDKALEWFRESETRKSSILNSSMDAIVTLDANGAILEFNPAAERTFGMLGRQVAGKDFIRLFVPVEERDTLRHSLETGFSAASGWLVNRRNSYSLLRAQDQTFPVEVTVTKALNDDGSLREFTLHIRDATRHVKLQERLRQLAYNDPLTGLFNRTFMMDKLGHSLQSAMQEETSLALLFLDLDKFKTINDTLGHKAGDELLCEVARRLEQATRKGDYVSRWGGDEFVILMGNGANAHHAMSLANRILEAMKVPVVLQDRELKIGTSVGVAVACVGDSVERLIQKADMAMYWAKENGRGTVRLFDDKMAVDISGQFDLVEEMKTSLENGDFSVALQPQVDSVTGDWVACEALIRWHHPKRGLIMPEEFIPLAEKSDFICEIGEWMFKETLSTIVQLREKVPFTTPVSVNVSGRHLLKSGFVTMVENALDQAKLTAADISIEITEGTLLDDIDRAVWVLEALRDLGIRIALDDFGSGYSSLKYLQALPLDLIKIDKAFTESCTEAAGASFCEAIVKLAENLTIEVMAEGVESAEQAQALRLVGCHLQQGFLYSQPLTMAQLQHKLAMKRVSLGRLEANDLSPLK